MIHILIEISWKILIFCGKGRIIEHFIISKGKTQYKR